MIWYGSTKGRVRQSLLSLLVRSNAQAVCPSPSLRLIPTSTYLLNHCVAPQKIAYMSDSYWKSLPNPSPVQSTFITGMPTMFSQPNYSASLNSIRESKGIAAEFNTNLIEVRPSEKIAVFEILAGDKKGKKVEKEFGLLHVTPPMGPLDVIKKSGLADGAGWVDVDMGSLQHKKYENVFSLGDSSSLPTSKVRLSYMNCRSVPPCFSLTKPAHRSPSLAPSNQDAPLLLLIQSQFIPFYLAKTKYLNPCLSSVNIRQNVASTKKRKDRRSNNIPNPSARPQSPNPHVNR